MDCQEMEMRQLVALAQRRVECTGQTNDAETDSHRTIGPPGSEMELKHTCCQVRN